MHKKLAQHILAKKIENPLGIKRYQERAGDATRPHWVPGPTAARKIGSLRNDNGDGNENGKKAEG